MAIGLAMMGSLAACSGTGTTDPGSINQLLLAADGNTAIVKRDTGFAGSAPRVFVYMDGQQVAALGNNEVGTFQARPGKHSLALKFEGIDIGLRTNSLIYDNDPTRPQYFVITLKQGLLSATMNITEVSRDSFQSIVN